MGQKPSRTNNLSYLILGYYLSSVFTYNRNLSLDQQAVFIIAFGSLIGTLIYYIKPVERAIKLYFMISGKNKSYPEQLWSQDVEAPVFKSDVMLSSYLQDDRTIINGAFFLAVGIVLSHALLQSAGISEIYPEIVVLAGILICIGIWECYILVSKKIPVVLFFYNYYDISKNIPALQNAIERKDWIEAEKIMEKEPELLAPEIMNYQKLEEIFPKGVCTKCQAIRVGNYCPECGEKIITECKNCKLDLIGKKDKLFPKFCKKCGEKIV